MIFYNILKVLIKIDLYTVFHKTSKKFINYLLPLLLCVNQRLNLRQIVAYLITCKILEIMLYYF